MEELFFYRGKAWEKGILDIEDGIVDKRENELVSFYMTYGLLERIIKNESIEIRDSLRIFMERTFLDRLMGKDELAFGEILQGISRFCGDYENRSDDEVFGCKELGVFARSSMILCDWLKRGNREENIDKDVRDEMCRKTVDNLILLRNEILDEIESKRIVSRDVKDVNIEKGEESEIDFWMKTIDNVDFYITLKKVKNSCGKVKDFLGNRIIPISDTNYSERNPLMVGWEEADEEDIGRSVSVEDDRNNRNVYAGMVLAALKKKWNIDDVGEGKKDGVKDEKEDHPSLKLDHPSLKLDHPSLKLDHPSLKLDHPSLKLDHPSLKLDHPSLEGSSIMDNQKIVSYEEYMSGVGRDDDFEEMPRCDETIYGGIDNNGHKRAKYYNTIRKGFEWHKYNKAHYDLDNPPPRVIMGYKFNIFYPELTKHRKAPSWKLISGKCPEECIIIFKAGPPYQDLAFTIVNKEWNYLPSRGFKNSFQYGILHLWFTFKRQGYRR